MTEGNRMKKNDSNRLHPPRFEIQSKQGRADKLLVYYRLVKGGGVKPLIGHKMSDLDARLTVNWSYCLAFEVRHIH